MFEFSSALIFYTIQSGDVEMSINFKSVTLLFSNAKQYDRQTIDKNNKIDDFILPNGIARCNSNAENVKL